MEKNGIFMLLDSLTNPYTHALLKFIKNIPLFGSSYKNNLEIFNAAFQIIQKAVKKVPQHFLLQL